MSEPFINLNCHLESADSVRTNPTGQFRERHFARLFAEAFTHILIGEELRLGQTPLYDSHGMVQFLGELLRAWEQFRAERRDDIRVPRFSPVVMTHYKKIVRLDGTQFVFDDPKDVLLNTFLINTEKPDFTNSALPEIGKTPDELVNYVRKNRFDIDSMPEDLSGQLANYEKSHLESLDEIDRYFRNHPDVVFLNRMDKFISLKKSVASIFAQQDIVKLSHEAKLVLGIYKTSLDDEDFSKYATKDGITPKYDRSHLYLYIERKLQDAHQPELFSPAKEVVDSLYMFNEANVAGAFAETTSSGVESDIQDHLALGEELNNFIDSTKFDPVINCEVPDLRPVLQLAAFDASPLRNLQYRSNLLSGLASFVASDSFTPLRRHIIDEIRKGKKSLAEYYEERLDQASAHPDLKGLITWKLSSTGAYSIKFCAEQASHLIAGLVPGSEASPESTEHVRETMHSLVEKQTGSEKFGNNLDLS